ncbi:MAG TPA: ATP-binding protein [Chitinophagales bacterium]|jgi:SpoVK/Ycf46/Vps4 family AAA+-type ATPase|nr:ATP-binding protein [Chitinophagales bacterium]HQW79997.1 ATP-binding protein [Chitinophagales bacterium]
MESTITLKQEVLNNIGAIYNMSKDSNLRVEFFESVEKELSFLSNYLHVTKTQALLMAVIFTLNYKGRKVDLDDLNSYFNCNPLKLLEYSDDFVELYEKQLLLKNQRGHRRHRRFQLFGTDEEFSINEIIINKILKSETIPETLIIEEKFEDIFSLFEKVYELGQQRDEEEIPTNEVFKQTQQILNKNVHFPLISQINLLGISIDEKYLFLYVVWEFLNGDKSPWIERTFKGIYDKPNKRFTQIQKFLAKENKLIKEDLLKIQEAEFFDDARMELTEKALDLLNECGIKLYNKNIDKKKKDGVILPKDIPFRELIYSDNEAQQLELLKSLLVEENFKATQERLATKAIPKGITVLLYGAPGTGKTESVLQIAKATNREIMKVDISASRSMWFGQSEKIIKQVFEDYKSYAKNLETTPILFFNEADAIIAKRKEANSSNVSDTENRIQNVLLEEIENFEGILIATTNLATNMDTAFERRFLFKIKFQKPSIVAKSQIWKSKLPHLSNEDCELLASQFDFSGGQIDNIVRKNEINEIIYGNKVSLRTLIEFCKEETLSNQFSKMPIGFKR